MKKVLLFHYVSYGEKTPVYFDVQNIIDKKIGEFSVHPLQEYSAKFHPETITYTGVTVGGIHTGGFSKTEAHYTTKSKNTAYAELRYKENSTSLSSPISEVIFSKELKQIALREIGGLFNQPEKNGYHLYKKSGSGFSESTYMNAISSGNMIAQASLLNSSLANHVTADVCSKVGSFLLRAIHGEFLTPQQKCEAANILLNETDALSWVAAADLLQNPTTPQERELAQQAAQKIGNAKTYKLGNRVYKDKSNYIKGLVNYIFKKATVPVIVICVILGLLACMPGRDTSGYFIALMIIGGIWFMGRGISETNFLPDKNSYYETK
ncbi:MAG: hypothetical protein E7421_07130 [Ruminococcaceae bacterium]|nr:hypothetical protein [Oscillospiraceae bacterium]